MQFGPTIRAPAARTVATSSDWRPTPASPTSPKPAETTSNPRAPAATDCLTAESAEDAGSAMTARSTGRPMDSIDGYVALSSTFDEWGLTRYISPLKPP